MDPNSLGRNAQNMVDEIQNSEAAERARFSLEHSKAGAQHIATRGKAAIRSGLARAGQGFDLTTDRAANYVQARPFKALLWATAAGAAIALVAGALSTRGNRRVRD